MSQILTDTLRNEYVVQSKRGSTLHAFILDFRLVSGDVYIDFKSLPSSYNYTQPQKQPLILNLVTKQFVTFRLINLPSQLGGQGLRILLNGDASVNYLVKKPDEKRPHPQQQHTRIEVVHSPSYDDFENKNRSEWISYLKKTTAGVSEIGLYVEYLNLFYHVSHLRLDLPLMIRITTAQEEFKTQRLGNLRIQS